MTQGDPPISKLDYYRRKFGRPAESMFEGMSNDDSNLVFNESQVNYGGDMEDPRENWGHVFGNVLNMKNTENKTLRECLDAYNVQIVRSDG